MKTNDPRYPILGYIYCDGGDGNNSVEVTVPSQSEYGWTGGGTNCREGTQHYFFDSSGQGLLVSKEQACSSVSQICAAPPSQAEVEQMNSGVKKSFWRAVWKAITNAAHDLFGADAKAACETNIGYRTIRITTSSNIAQVVSNPEADLKVFQPESKGITATQINFNPLPNLQVQHFYVYNSAGNQLNEGSSNMAVGNTYDIQVWLVSQDADAESGAQSGMKNIETDVFYKIALEEPAGHWKHLGRVYTRPSSLPKDDGHKELLPFTVPTEAKGQRIYFKSKVDSTGEVKETNEHDNWSDAEWYPVPGDCDLTASYARLTKNRADLYEGERYGFETAIKDVGSDPCPLDIRSAYYHKKPGSRTWDYVTDDGTPASKLIPGQENPELTLDEPFVADTPGIHEIMVCADYLNSNQETDESNNCASSSFEVKMYRPDLVIAQVGLTGNRSNLLQGDKFGLSTIITNQGNAPSPVDTRLAYYLLPPGASAWAYQTDDFVSKDQMCVGCSQTEWNTTDPYTASTVGWWQGMTCADYLNNATELDEANNCRSFSFYVALAGPDLIVSALSLKEGAVIKKGSYVHPRCTAKNAGNKPANADMRLGYYIDGEYRTDDFVGKEQMCVGCSQSEQVNSDIIKLGKTGTRTYTCCVDVNGNVSELNEQNNCASVSFTVK